MKRTGLSIIASAFLLFGSVYANDSEILLKEGQQETFITKKPTIKCICPEIADAEDMIILLDENDITALVKKTENGLTFKPVEILNGGEHTLNITYYINGEEKQKEFTFKTRQSENFETANTKLSINPVYENTLMKPKDLDNVPYSKIESDFSLQSNLSEGRWTYSFDTNVRFFDQSLPISQTQNSQEGGQEEILKKGFNLTTYLFKANYSSEQLKGGIEIGDFQIEESDYSASGITKRGARGTISYNRYDVEAFIANSVDYFGFYGGMGLDPDDKKRLYGASIQKTFLEDTKFKIIYIKGGKDKEGFGEASDSFPSQSSNEEGAKKGRVIAFVLSSPIIQDKLNFYAEADFSKYDMDLSDEYGYEKDKAYNVKLNGMLTETLNYDFMYSYIGPDFYSIANESSENDSEGAELNLNADFDVHSIYLSFSDYHDNVEDNDEFATVYTYNGSINYSYSGFENVPIELGYEKAITKSKDEPTDNDEDKQDAVTDTYTANIGYYYNTWQFSLGTEYSKENDKIQSVVTKSYTYTFSPSYQGEKLSLSPNISYNISKTDDDTTSTDTEQKTTTVGLDIGYLILENLSFNLSGTYEYTKDEENGETNGKEEKIDGSMQLAYNFQTNKNWLQNPTIGLKGEYSYIHDKISDDQNEDFVLKLFLSIPMQFIF